MRNLPVITRNLLLINFLIWAAEWLFPGLRVMLPSLFGLHYVTATGFHFWQPLTYMFLHANFSHLFCNMFAVLMFAPVLEREWGERRFLIYYLICGLGAALVQECVWAIELSSVMSGMEERLLTIGASGAVFGILLAFGWMFPNVEMFLLFIPIPIRARTFVMLYAAFELFFGLVPMAGDNVAHFAHLGGMLFGALLIGIWNKWGDEPWNRVYRFFHGLFHRHPRLDSTDKEGSKNWSDYHYQKRVD